MLLQVAVCFGLMTPLFIAYTIEAKAKLRFAFPEGSAAHFAVRGNPIYNMMRQTSTNDSIALLIFYLNVLFWVNTAVVALVAAFGGSHVM